MKVDVYWSHSFLPDLIRPDGLVFDFGVNDGGFARLVAPRCRKVIGFEPDPSWEGRLELPGNMHLEKKAVAAKSGTITLHVNRDLCSSMHYAGQDTETVAVEAVTLAEALAVAPEGRIDLLKMDIEGEELPVLRHAPDHLFRRVVQLAVEFHDFLDPSSIPTIREVMARMRDLGFHVVCFSWRSYGDVLFINKALAPLPAWQRLWLTLRYKYARGIGRILRRAIQGKRTA